MRQRIALIVVVIAFAGAITGASLVAGGGGGRGLPRLPLLRLGAPSSSSAALAQPAPGGAAPAFAFDYRVEGSLPKLPDRAPAYTLGTEEGAPRVDRLVAALGLKGRAQPAGQGWLLQDGTRVLSVQKQPGLPWSLFDMGPCGGTVPPLPPSSAGGGAIAGCAVAGEAGAGGVAGGAVASAPAPVVAPSSSGCPQPPCPAGKDCPNACVPPNVPPVVSPPRPADLPTRDEAERVARDVLSRAGGPSLSGASVRIMDAFSSWVVQMDPTIDGLTAVGMQESVFVGPKSSIVNANGWLATPRRVGDYPLAGVDEGLDRLRHGFGGGPVPMGAEGAVTATATASAPVAAPPLAPGPPVPASVGGAAPAGVGPSSGGTASSAVACSLYPASEGSVPPAPPKAGSAPGVAGAPGASGAATPAPGGPTANAPIASPPCVPCAAVGVAPPPSSNGAGQSSGAAVSAPTCPPVGLACPPPAGATPAGGTAVPALYPYCGPIVQTITGVHLAPELVPSFTVPLPPSPSASAPVTAPAHLEPAYVFELKGGGTTFPVPAVIDADLQQVVPPAPTPRPLPPVVSPGQPVPAAPTKPAEPPATFEPHSP